MTSATGKFVLYFQLLRCSKWSGRRLCFVLDSEGWNQLQNLAEKFEDEILRKEIWLESLEVCTDLVSRGDLNSLGISCRIRQKSLKMKV